MKRKMIWTYNICHKIVCLFPMCTLIYSHYVNFHIESSLKNIIQEVDLAHSRRPACFRAGGFMGELIPPHHSHDKSKWNWLVWAAWAVPAPASVSEESPAGTENFIECSNTISSCRSYLVTASKAPYKTPINILVWELLKLGGF